MVLVPAICSDAVADLVAAAAKLRADDPVLTSPAAMLGDIEAILESVTVVQAVLVRRLADVVEADATSAECGRSTRGWLIEEQLLPAAEAGRDPDRAGHPAS